MPPEQRMECQHIQTSFAEMNKTVATLSLLVLHTAPQLPSLLYGSFLETTSVMTRQHETAENEHAVRALAAFPSSWNGQGHFRSRLRLG